MTPGAIDTFFFANSGAEITEAAIKLAKQATGRPNVIVFAGSFHGRTHLTMAMTTSKTIYRAGHAPLPAGVFVAPFPDPLAEDEDAEVDRALRGLDHLLATMTAPGETAAMILEPVLGEGGYAPAPAAFLAGIVERCRAHGILFVADEVQSGFGRTGEMFAVDHHGIQPDVICMAKGIASGFPFAALGTRRELDDRWPTGSHGGTYGGNPIGCAAALATHRRRSPRPGSSTTCGPAGEQLGTGLRKLQAQDAGVVQVRGLGLMIASELDDTARVAAITAHCLRRGPPHPDERRHPGPRRAVDAAARGLGGRDRRGARRVRRRPRGDGLTARWPGSTRRASPRGASCSRSRPSWSGPSTRRSSPSGTSRSAGSTCSPACSASAARPARATSPSSCGWCAPA